MATTYEAIATVTVGSGGESDIEFTSIPQTYTDLLVKLSTRADADTVQLSVSFNGVTANRSNRMLWGNSSTAGSESSASSMYSYGSVASSVSNASTFSNVDYYITNYAGATHKAMSIDSVNERNLGTANAAWMSFAASLWSDTAAITSVTFTCTGANFVQYSTATLYGIKKN